MAQRRDLNKSNSKTASDTAARSTTSYKIRSPKQISAKCVRCAPRSGAPIDSIAVSIRQGRTQLAIVQPIYCAGLVPQQLYACIKAILAVLQRDYEITQFAQVVQQLLEGNSAV